MHKHETGNNINYIVSGMGKAICDDDEESLFAGSAIFVKKILNIALLTLEQRILP